MKLNYKACYELKIKAGDNGIDIRSIEDVVLKPMETRTVRTSLFLKLDNGDYADVRGRSGLNNKGILCHLGLVDNSYRGEIGVTLTNLCGSDFIINKYDRIAQLVLHNQDEIDLKIVEVINKDTTRGDKGFGSSGIK